MEKKKMKTYDDPDFQEKGIRKSFIEFLKGSTTKERAFVYFNQYRGAKKPRINKEEAELVQYMGTFRMEDEKEWKGWQCLYNTLTDFAPLMAMMSMEWSIYRERITSLIDMLDALKTIQAIYDDHVNTIVNAQQRHKAAEQCKQRLRGIRAIYGACFAENIDENGYIHLDVNGIKNRIIALMREAQESLSGIKAYEIVCLDFCRMHDCRELLPLYAESDMNNAHTDDMRRYPEWSKRELLKREKNGERITEHEREMAIYPFYEDTPSDKKAEDMAKDSIEYFYNMEKTRLGIKD